MPRRVEITSNSTTYVTEGTLQCWISWLRMSEGLRSAHFTPCGVLCVSVLTWMEDRAKHDNIRGNWGQLCVLLGHHVLPVYSLFVLCILGGFFSTIGPFHRLVLWQIFASSTTCVNKGKYPSFQSPTEPPKSLYLRASCSRSEKSWPNSGHSSKVKQGLASKVGARRGTRIRETRTLPFSERELSSYHLGWSYNQIFLG